MSFEVRVAASAKADLVEAHGWIAERAPEAAMAWFDTVCEEIESLARLPERFPRAPEASTLGRDLRHMVVGNYRVIFAVEGRTVVVVHVRHAARRAVGEHERED